MVVQMDETKLQESNSAAKSEIWVNEFGLLDNSQFDLGTKSYQGKIYRLTPEEKL
jgi:hypothetical protein